MKNLLSWLFVLLAAYGGLCALLYLLQDRMLFLPRSTDPQAAIALQPWRYSVVSDGVTLAGWLIPAREPQNAPLVFYYGGNAEDISATGLDASTRADANFVVMNYRGYGGSEGKPSQDALFADAVFTFDKVVRSTPHNGKAVVFGRSLGSGVAIHLAARRNIDAAVLVTPFDSVRNLATRLFPWLPVALLLRHPFDSISLASDLNIPALFLLAERDEVVPADHSQALIDRWGGDKRVVTIKNAGHNTLGGEQEFWQPIRELLSQLK